MDAFGVRTPGAQGLPNAGWFHMQVIGEFQGVHEVIVFENADIEEDGFV